MSCVPHGVAAIVPISATDSTTMTWTLADGQGFFHDDCTINITTITDVDSVAPEAAPAAEITNTTD